MNKKNRPSGIPALGDVGWGSHVCQFYQNASDLLDVLIPYFKAGLDNNEFCMWVTSKPISCAEAEAALRAAIDDFDARVARGQMLIVPTEAWYLHEGIFDSRRVLDGWAAKLADALAGGYEGLRLSGNTFWLEKSDWGAFSAYESEVDALISRRHVIALCTYSLERCGVNEVLDVVNNHECALIRRNGAWELIENGAKRRAIEAAKEWRLNYESLSGNIAEGHAYHEIVTNEAGEPVDYIFLEANEAIERMLGLQREAFIGKRVTEVMPGIENDPSEWIRLFGRVALTGEPVRVERYGTLLGKWFSVSAYSPQRGRFALAMEDVTERKESEAAIRTLNAELKRQLQELELSNRELESFAYSVSHDLIAPLRSINGYCHILLEDHGEQLDADAKRMLEHVNGSSRHMARLIDALLELSRLTRAELKRTRVNVSALARDIATVLREREPARNVAVLIEDEIHADADPFLLRVALENLIGNAWKFTDTKSEARIEFSCEYDGDTPIYRVRDNGVGFDMHHAGKLFNAFQRLHTQQEFPGLGIGLATVHRIVQRHGGRVWAEAAPGQGATFFFKLS